MPEKPGPLSWRRYRHKYRVRWRSDAGESHTGHGINLATQTRNEEGVHPELEVTLKYTGVFAGKAISFR